MFEVKVPDIGDFQNVPIIEIFVKPGDAVKAEDALLTLESDKAAMDVPAPTSGVVKEVKVNVGEKVSEGSLIVLLEDGVTTAIEKTATPAPPTAQNIQPAQAATSSKQDIHAIGPVSLDDFRPQENEPIAAPPQVRMPGPAEIIMTRDGIKAHASPSVRRFAREIGVDINVITGSGEKGRITQADVQAYTKGIMQEAQITATTPAPAASGASTEGLNLLPWPQVDFAKFGPIEKKPLSRIKKISGPNLARNWVMIPAVTYHEDADITELEALRVKVNKENGIKVTMLAFIIKAAIAALQKYPELNASLEGDELVFKNYWNIGFAADTPNGLMVPVLKNANQKGVLELSSELAELSLKARQGKLPPGDMQGATFTISSIGGLGGTAFSPIVNAPEVAILGVNKSALQPVWDGQQFQPRLILPLSLSADHRVIDGALATRFNAFIAKILGDFRRVVL